MIEIKSENQGKGRDTKTKLSWNYEGNHIALNLPSIARYIYVEDNKSLFVSLYLEGKIYRYSLNGKITASFEIPSKVGYQYRGINRNLKTKHGISLLFHPTLDGFGNQWKDTEQYELESELNPLGKYLGIYR